jgi:dienelactone hydrolase
VGKVDYDLVDQSRREIFINNPQAKREILVTVYYPANPTPGTQPSPFLQGKTLATFAQVYHVPANFINSALHSNAYANAPLAGFPERFPVVLFSPGWGTTPLLYAPTLEDLASHGYIVAALWHTYSCNFTVFPDGRVVYANKAGSDPDHYPDEQNQQVQIRERVGGVWSADAQFVINEFTQFNQDNPLFSGHLDLAHIGMFGHSFGGTVSLETGKGDNRLKAVIDVDGGLGFKEPVTHPGLQKPTMLMFADDPKVTDEELKKEGLTRQQYEKALAQYHAYQQDYYERSNPAYLLRLKNSAHMTYASTMALIAPLDPDQITSTDVGTINGAHAVHIYDSYLIAFFNQHLKHIPAPILCNHAPHDPDVKFESHQ